MADALLNFKLANHEKRGLFAGDCMEFMRGMESNTVALTITSPPYDNLRRYDGYTFNFEGIADELYRVTEKGGVVVWVIGDRINQGRSLTSFRQGLYFQSIGFSMHDVMIYRKKKLMQVNIKCV